MRVRVRVCVPPGGGVALVSFFPPQTAIPFAARIVGGLGSLHGGELGRMIDVCVCPGSSWQGGSQGRRPLGCKNPRKIEKIHGKLINWLMLAQFGLKMG